MAAFFTFSVFVLNIFFTFGINSPKTDSTSCSFESQRFSLFYDSPEDKSNNSVKTSNSSNRKKRSAADEQQLFPTKVHASFISLGFSTKPSQSLHSKLFRRSSPLKPSQSGPEWNGIPWNNFAASDAVGVPEMQMFQQQMGSYGSSAMQTQWPMPNNGYNTAGTPTYGVGGVHSSSSPQINNGGGSPPTINSSPYAGYLEKHISTYPIMIYTLTECIPCQNAKHLLAVHYPDVRAHFLDLSGNEPWQQQLQIDLQYLTGANTFPYIFVCGQYIGGADDLFELHQNGQLRKMVSQCLRTPNPKK